MSAEVRVPSAAVAMLQWEGARWMRVSPGRLGSAALVGLGLIFFFPLSTLEVFGTWEQASVMVAALGAVAIGVALGREVALPRPEDLWVYQRGQSLLELTFTRWMIADAVAGLLIVWWTGCWALAALVHGADGAVATVVPLAIWLFILYLLVSSVLFALGAAGHARGSDLVFLLLLLALIQPVLSTVLHPAASRVMEILLPPLHAATTLRDGLVAGESFRIIAPALLHVVLFVGVMIGAGALLLSRRRPMI